MSHDAWSWCASGRAGLDQDPPATAAGLPWPEYARVEAGPRPLDGGEAIMLPDALGVGVIRRPVRCPTHPSTGCAGAQAMADRLVAH